MIARIWRARATTDNTAAYARYLQTELIPKLRMIDGYQGTRLFQQQHGGEAEITVVTWWASLDAIRGFAGDDITKAVVEDKTAALLIEYDREVEYHELLVADDM